MITEISSLQHPGLAPFASLTEAQLRNRLDPSRGIVIVESPKVIRTALQAGLEPLSLLCERRHIAGDAADIIERLPNIPVYTGERELLASLTGYTLTRGVLCAMRRPQPLCARDVLEGGAQRICVLWGVTDSTNVGAIFRCAAALGTDGLLLSRDTCDPLGRRALRVSMGTVLQVPWAWADDPIASLKSCGFATAAMALTERSVPMDAPALKTLPKLGVIMGTEGDGLPADVIRRADHVVRIPMHRGVDSLNVAAAAAIALWELRRPDAPPRPDGISG
ncbi:MAG: RNA methyltransferase [Alloprevotella sp.]|nr:RNA methyltransferase [Alloprevotella sp.]